MQWQVSAIGALRLQVFNSVLVFGVERVSGVHALNYPKP